jgi:O-antigen/teichoic acid export membrane protein
MVAQNYLLCREKAHLASVALLVGLVVNVVLNLILLPRLQLLGAVLATTAANLVALILLYALSHRLGFRTDFGTRAVLAVPLVYSLGPWVTLVFLGAIVFEAFYSDRMLSRDEKRELADGLAAYWQRIRKVGVRLKPSEGGP